MTESAYALAPIEPIAPPQPINSHRSRRAIVGLVMIASGCSAGDPAHAGDAAPRASHDIEAPIYNPNVETPSDDTESANQFFHGEPLLVSPNSAADYLSKHPKDINKKKLQFLTNQPVANWLYSANSKANVLKTLKSVMSLANRKKAVAPIVTYVLTDRDAGGYSSNDATNSPTAYKAFVNQAVQAEKANKNGGTINVIEPDALPFVATGGIKGHAADVAIDEVHYDVEAYGTVPNALNYVDVGKDNFGGSSPETIQKMAALLKEVFTDEQGNPLPIRVLADISAYRTKPQIEGYLKALANAVGRPIHYMQDTSRNGKGDYNNETYNPARAHMAPGDLPNLNDVSIDQLLVRDGELWVNFIGGSDCNTKTNNDQTSCIHETLPPPCPPIGPPGSWNACVAIGALNGSKYAGKIVLPSVASANYEAPADNFALAS